MLVLRTIGVDFADLSFDVATETFLGVDTEASPEFSFGFEEVGRVDHEVVRIVVEGDVFLLADVPEGCVLDAVVDGVAVALDVEVAGDNGGEIGGDALEGEFVVVALDVRCDRFRLSGGFGFRGAALFAEGT